MLDRIAHAALAIVYLNIAVISVLDGASAHAVCALTAAMIYAVLCWGSSSRT